MTGGGRREAWRRKPRPNLRDVCLLPPCGEVEAPCAFRVRGFCRGRCPAPKTRSRCGALTSPAKRDLFHILKSSSPRKRGSHTALICRRSRFRGMTAKGGRFSEKVCGRRGDAKGRAAPLLTRRDARPFSSKPARRPRCSGAAPRPGAFAGVVRAERVGETPCRAPGLNDLAGLHHRPPGRPLLEPAPRSCDTNGRRSVALLSERNSFPGLLSAPSHNPAPRPAVRRSPGPAADDRPRDRHALALAADSWCGSGRPCSGDRPQRPGPGQPVRLLRALISGASRSGLGPRWRRSSSAVERGVGVWKIIWQLAGGRVPPAPPTWTSWPGTGCGAGGPLQADDARPTLVLRCRCRRPAPGSRRDGSPG